MENLIVIKSVEDLHEVEAYIRDNDFIAVDTETTGVTNDSKIIGFSVSAHADTGYYVILSYWHRDVEIIEKPREHDPNDEDAIKYDYETIDRSKLVDLPTKVKAKKILQLLVGKALIMHNAIFDCQMVFNNFGVELMPSVHTDTMLLAHILDENRHCGLKELGVSLFGEDSKAEQTLMKDSVHKNGGKLTKAEYELYKADAELIGKYGAKDTILTIKLFYLFVEQLYEQGLDKFFYDEESMPLLRGPTYDLNRTGLKVDVTKLQDLKGTLESEILEARTIIDADIKAHIAVKYPATSKKNTFNIGSNNQVAWLLFERLGNSFNTLTKGGKDLCKALNIRMPYAMADKRRFIQSVKDSFGVVAPNGKKVKEYWTYLSLDKKTLELYSKKYRWVEKLLFLSKQEKILDTYVVGIQQKLQYGIIRPSFLQHGTTSGRYSSRNPNFQNLPRKDKRIKACITSRPGKVFVGADYAQLEPRVFASMSQDYVLMNCFAKGEDFYSVVGAPIFGKTEYSLIKDHPESFATKFPDLRDKAKVIALATPYGRTDSFMASEMGIERDEARDLMDKYFLAYDKVEKMMLDSHEEAKTNGATYSLFGRPRRIPEAKKINKIYGDQPHSRLPYEARTLLNLAMNHKIQSTGASIMNRAAIAFWENCQKLALTDSIWKEVKIVMQIHDELVIEAPESVGSQVAKLLKYCMETTVELPGVALIAEPKIATNLADLK